MKTLVHLFLCCILAALPCTLARGSEQKQGDLAQAPHIKSVRLTGTIYANFDYEFEGTGAWLGYLLIQFGDTPKKTAKIIVRNTSFGMRDNGEFYGTEVYSVTFEDHSGSFEITASFLSILGNTPGMYTLHEEGTIGNGTGDYKKISGSIRAKGVYVDPDGTTDAPPAISELHGSVSY